MRARVPFPLVTVLATCPHLLDDLAVVRKLDDHHAVLITDDGVAPGADRHLAALDYYAVATPMAA